MKSILVVASALMTVILVGCSGGEPPIAVVQGTDVWGKPDLTITAVADEVAVQAVKFNRGNCETNDYPKFPRALKFGETTTVFSRCSPAILEAEVTTDKGTFNFSFE